MGWCSATNIMDTALGAAYSVVSEVVEAYAQGNADATAIRTRADEVLRPFVTTLAERLRDSDWDCIDESEYFDRFPQEMLGMDDHQYRRYLNDRLRDTDPDEYGYAELVAKLDALNKKMEDPVNGSG